MVMRAYGAMTNDTLISIPLFVLMGYVMERGALVDKMFYSVQLAFRRMPASLAVARTAILPLLCGQNCLNESLTAGAGKRQLVRRSKRYILAKSRAIDPLTGVLRRGENARIRQRLTRPQDAGHHRDRVR
jgi:tripartite ATP-independent transporter DctM subunit